jgi:hypothetical protein
VRHSPAVEQLDAIMKHVESSADPKLRSQAAEFVEAVMTLHGEALERIVQIAQSDPPTLARLLDDDLISSLLVLYDLHPHDMESRVRATLTKLRARGVKAELIDTGGGDVCIKLAGGCGSPKELIEEAVYQAAPDLASLRIEEESPAVFVPVASLSNGRIARTGGQ